MNKEPRLKSIKLLPLLKKYSARYGRHAAFAGIILVLLIYAFVVLKINTLAKAEPNPDQEQTVTTAIPHIDSQAIQQIQNLENNNASIHSLFEQARNNPFQE